MRIVEKEIKFGRDKSRKLYYEQFHSYQEYLQIVEERMKTNSHSVEHDWEHLTSDKKWCGVSNYKEARDLLLNGWDKEVETLKKSISKEIDICDKKQFVKQFSDIVGYVPIVPHVIMNLPNSMINFRKDTKKTKVIKFLIGMNRSWTYSSKEIIEKMSKIFARICLLERQGYRCRIEMIGQQSSEGSSKTIVAHTVLIKSENQLMDVKRVCFPIVHSAMQRVFSFGWENCLPLEFEEYHDYGMGVALQYWEKENRDKVLEAINENGEKLIYISVDSDIEELFGERGEVYE